MVTDSRDRERKKASLSAGRFSCLTWPSAKRYHSRLITLPLTASQINCPFPQTWRSWWGWGCCGRPDSLFPLYRVPGGLLAACFLTGILVGKSDSRTMNSVEWWISLFPKGFLLSAQPERWTSWWKKPTAKWRGCAGGERDAREELGSNCADYIKDTEITKLWFSPQDYFCFSHSSIIFVTPSSSFHPVILFMPPSFSYMISSSLTWLLFSFPLLSIIFFFHPVFPSLTLVSYHPNFFFILNLIFLLSFSHLQWLIFPSLFLTHPSSWLCSYFFLLAVSIFVIWLFLCSRWLQIIWEMGRTKTVLLLDLGN